MSDPANQLEAMIAQLQHHGSSLTMKWSDDAARWEVAWTVGRTRRMATADRLIAALSALLAAEQHERDVSGG